MTYERLRPLGRGGTAEVWLARDAAGRLVALKRTADARPALAAAALRHPNVLGVLATDGDVLVLPYVPGGSLAAALAAGARYAVPQAAALGAALADALAAAHAAGLVHGDVKAGNVLLDGPGTPLLADFAGVGEPAEDVRALAALLTTLAPGLAPLVAAAPDAAALRDALRAADLPVDGDDPEPTRGFGTPPPPAPAPAPAARRAARGAGRRSPLRVATVAALAVLVAVLA
ncbi:MAG TPA: protein kinase, partial [Solirubrobacteraceae bacterium]|nr:protein kinase [Solirubrobacteraceae bacterium]